MPLNTGNDAGVLRVKTMIGFYTIPEFLYEYPMGRSSLYRLVSNGQIRLTKFGRSSRIAKADALAWAQTLPTFGGRAH
jgi:excisionase family DNA binding protein